MIPRHARRPARDGPGLCWYATGMMLCSLIVMMSGLAIAPALPAAPPAEVTVTADNTVISSSCRVVIPAGTVIPDADGNGVIQIKGDNITIEFAAGSELWGADPAAPGDTLTGTGIVVSGGRRITIKGAAVHGYKVGVRVQKTTAFTIDGMDISGNFRQHLASTPQAEVSSDWLFPHNNDKNEWATNYGAGLLIEDSQQATVKNVICRRGQNGIMLVRVNDSKIYDNDCSFLSGWGLSMWRSSKNMISRNALDFCVRGHVEGVYNRGQDSAGLLMFEQCSNNIIAENSITHGGDGFFSFAGNEAIGETPAPAGFAYGRKGCNDNLFLRNDFSYASAHGLELTFSHGNKIVENRFEENAICGIWAGYSQDTIITRNEFIGNGGMAYGLERGAINMEHASDNKIFENTFLNNKVAVHLWWDNDAALLEKPGVKKGYKGVSGNVIAENDVTVNADHPFRDLKPDAMFYAWQFRDVAERPADKDAAPKTGKKKDEHFKNNQVSQNVVQMTGVPSLELAVDPGTEPKDSGPTPKFQLPRLEILGERTPYVSGDRKRVSPRARLAGRKQIIMDEWGPWDHESPLLRAANTRGANHAYELLGAADQPVSATIEPSTLAAQVQQGSGDSPGRITITGGSLVQPYTLKVKVGSTFERTVKATLMPARWTVAFFPWNDDTDPRQEAKLPAWRKLGAESKARGTIAGELALRFGGGGPASLKLGKSIEESMIGNDHFGAIATTRFMLPAGKWRVWTMSDDGVRLAVNGKNVIENWSWHGPTRDTAEFTQDKEGPVDLKVEYFEIDGHAVLEVGVEAVP